MPFHFYVGRSRHAADLIALAAPVVFIAYVVFGMTGFGAAMVACPFWRSSCPCPSPCRWLCCSTWPARRWSAAELAAGVARGTGAAVSVDAAGHLPGRDAAAQCRRALAADRAGLLRADGLRARPEGRRAPARNRCPRPGRCRSACSVACSARCSARAGRSTPSTCRAASPRWTRSAPRFRSSSWPAASSAPGPSPLPGCIRSRPC